MPSKQETQQETQEGAPDRGPVKGGGRVRGSVGGKRKSGQVLWTAAKHPSWGMSTEGLSFAAPGGSALCIGAGLWRRLQCRPARTQDGAGLNPHGHSGTGEEGEARRLFTPLISWMCVPSELCAVPSCGAQTLSSRVGKGRQKRPKGRSVAASGRLRFLGRYLHKLELQQNAKL